MAWPSNDLIKQKMWIYIYINFKVNGDMKPLKGNSNINPSLYNLFSEPYSLVGYNLLPTILCPKCPLSIQHASQPICASKLLCPFISILSWIFQDNLKLKKSWHKGNRSLLNVYGCQEHIHLFRRNKWMRFSENLIQRSSGHLILDYKKIILKIGTKSPTFWASAVQQKSNTNHKCKPCT